MKSLTLVLSLFLVLPALAQQAPPVDAILAGARQVAALQKQDLEGKIQKGSRKIPIALFLNREQGNIQFQIYGAKKEWEKFHLRLKEDDFELFEIMGGKTRRFPEAKLAQAIEGTDLTYEDLAMRFLYWKGGKLVGQEKIKGADCWVIRVNNPGKGGLYHSVEVAVHKKAGALWRAIGFDAQGQKIKKFEISDIMKVDGAFAVRAMRVDTIQPVSGKTIGITRMFFDNPEIKKGRPGFR